MFPHLNFDLATGQLPPKSDHKVTNRIFRFSMLLLLKDQTFAPRTCNENNFIEIPLISNAYRFRWCFK